VRRLSLRLVARADLRSLLRGLGKLTAATARQRGFSEIFPFFGLAQPGPTRFGMQYRLLPADRAERAVVPDVLRRRRPLQCFHDCLTPRRRHRCGNSALLFSRDFVPAARVSQQQLFKNAMFSRAERRAQETGQLFCRCHQWCRITRKTTMKRFIRICRPQISRT